MLSFFRNRQQSVSAETYIVRRIFRWAFVVRASMGILAWVATTIYDIPLMQDALFYEEMGWRVADEWLSGQSSPTMAWMMGGGNQAWVMVALVAVNYVLLGGLRIVPILILSYSVVTAFVPVWIYRIARQLGASEYASRAASWLVVFSPGFAFWSGALYKEGLIHLVLCLCVYHGLRLQERWNARSIWILALSLSALLGLRFYLAAILFVVISVSLFWGRGRVISNRPIPVSFRQVAVVAVLVSLMALLGFTGRMEALLPGNIDEGFQSIQRSRADLAESRSGYLPGIDVSTAEAAIQSLPTGLMYFLTVPLPWHFGALRQNITIPETAFWMLLYPLACVGMLHLLRLNKQGVFFLLMVVGILCVFYALMVGNIGTAYRMRMQVWLPLSVFIGVGWELLRPRVRAIMKRMV